MSFYWVTLAKRVRFRGADRSGFSVDADTETQAREIAAQELRTTNADIKSAHPLPYPGEPRLNYKSGACPSFCLHPDKCAGRTSCPRPLACSE